MCTGPLSLSCCNFFNTTGYCVTTCPGNTIPTPEFDCVCASGFTGVACDINIEYCDPNPCQNGGSCTNGILGFNCSCKANYFGETCMLCAPGFTGVACDMNIEYCDPNPCQNGGNCTNSITGFNCSCSANYFGETCTSMVECAPGFTGAACDMNIEYCDTNPCQNGGNCTNSTSGFNCNCSADYFGETCTSMVRGSPTSCDTLVNCQNGRTCLTINDNTALCKCSEDVERIACQGTYIRIRV